jgi:hypothetical protein
MCYFFALPPFFTPASGACLGCFLAKSLACSAWNSSSVGPPGNSGSFGCACRSPGQRLSQRQVAGSANPIMSICKAGGRKLSSHLWALDCKDPLRDESRQHTTTCERSEYGRRITMEGVAPPLTLSCAACASSLHRLRSGSAGRGVPLTLLLQVVKALKRCTLPAHIGSAIGLVARSRATVSPLPSLSTPYRQVTHPARWLPQSCP